MHSPPLCVGISTPDNFLVGSPWPVHLPQAPEQGHRDMGSRNLAHAGCTLKLIFSAPLQFDFSVNYEELNSHLTSSKNDSGFLKEIGGWIAE